MDLVLYCPPCLAPGTSMPWYQEILVEISTDKEHALKIIKMLQGSQRQKWMLVD